MGCWDEAAPVELLLGPLEVNGNTHDEGELELAEDAPGPLVTLGLVVGPHAQTNAAAKLASPLLGFIQSKAVMVQ